MTNRTITLWAVTRPDWRRGKIVGRRAVWNTVSYRRKDAIHKFRKDWLEERRAGIWDRYRKEHGFRVERVLLTVAEPLAHEVASAAVKMEK